MVEPTRTSGFLSSPTRMVYPTIPKVLQTEERRSHCCNSLTYWRFLESDQELERLADHGKSHSQLGSCKSTHWGPFTPNKKPGLSSTLCVGDDIGVMWNLQPVSMQTLQTELYFSDHLIFRQMLWKMISHVVWIVSMLNNVVLYGGKLL